MKNHTYKSIEKIVENYPTQHEYGFLWQEIEDLLTNFEGIDMRKFDDALRGNTCMVIDGKIITYHCDLVLAINCGIEKRDININEFD
jgi:hypothetical protein